jgi:HEAT repeat protein
MIASERGCLWVAPFGKVETMNTRRISLILAVALIALLSVAAFSNIRARALNDAPVASSPMVGNLTAQLQSDDPASRADAAAALAGTDDREATTALLANLGDTDPAAGYATAIALSESDDPTVADALVAELNNPDVLVRQRAALALAKIATPDAVPALAVSLQDASVSMTAAQALANIPTPEAQDALLTALADPEFSTQRHAAMAAIENADPAVADAILARALASDDAVLVQNATQLRDFMSK